MTRIEILNELFRIAESALNSINGGFRTLAKREAKAKAEMQKYIDYLFTNNLAETKRLVACQKELDNVIKCFDIVEA